MSEDSGNPRSKVGYKSPPVEHRFQPGQPSPNPKGRPRKNKAFQEAVHEQLNRKVAIKVNGKRKKASITEVALHRLGNMAVAGNLDAIKEVNKLNERIAPLAPQPQMSAEEQRSHDEAVAKVTALCMEALEMKAAAKKREGRSRSGATDTET